MSTIEIKQELHRFIDSQIHRFIDEGDDKFVKMFYEMAKAYATQYKKDRMLVEGEEDVDNERTYSLSEVRKLLGDWEEK